MGKQAGILGTEGRREERKQWQGRKDVSKEKKGGGGRERKFPVLHANFPQGQWENHQSFLLLLLFAFPWSFCCLGNEISFKR